MGDFSTETMEDGIQRERNNVFKASKGESLQAGISYL